MYTKLNYYFQTKFNYLNKIYKKQNTYFGLKSFNYILLIILIQKICLNNAQLISTKSQKFEARIGQTIQLPCTFSELGFILLFN